MIDSSMILKATFEKIIESINIGIFDLLHTGVLSFATKDSLSIATNLF